jgi:dienelactone hydrolase
MKKTHQLPQIVCYSTSLLCLFFLFCTCLSGQVESSTEIAQEMPDHLKEERTEQYKHQLETYLQRWIIEDYPERADKAWNRDYSSIDAFKRSVEGNRERWMALLNPPELRKTGPMVKQPHPYLEDVGAEWIELPLGAISAQGILAFPSGATSQNPVPLIVVQHGIGSYPETPFTMDHDLYHSYARELLKAGFAVLAPMNLRSMPFRNYIERLCRLIDTTLPGIELVRMQHLLDVVLEDPRLDAEHVGMWGLSLGGLATMFWMPLEPRIKAGVVSAWFNHRRNKMALPDDRYVSFMVVDEEHAFFRGWLTEFTDSDVVSLICPRPLMVHHGKNDRIAYWPQVVDEFEIAKTHYQKLDIADRIEIDIFEGGHEARIGSGVPFLERWLKP